MTDVLKQDFDFAAVVFIAFRKRQIKKTSNGQLTILAVRFFLRVFKISNLKGVFRIKLRGVI